MRWLAWLVLVCGPLLAAPAAAALWTHARLAGFDGVDLYALAAASACVLVEALLISVRGVVREATMLAGSIAWSFWLWFGMTREGYDWLSLPPIGAPDGLGRMVITLIALVYLTVYAVAEACRPRRA